MKYTRLTKIVEHNGKECVSCAFYGTKQCRIHNGSEGCSGCPVFAAILNQLCAFEECVSEEPHDTSEDKDG